MKTAKKFLIFSAFAVSAFIFPLAINGGATAAEPASVSAAQKLLIPGGQTIGVTLESEGILVLGTGNVTGKDRRIYSPADNILEEGDVILEAGGVALNDKEELASAVKNCGDTLSLTIQRRENVFDVSLSPVKCLEDGTNKIGIWVRDSTQGIGTLTYIDPADNSFGALGHGVYDADTGEMMSVKSGTIVGSNITGIKKSEKGSPGEMTGVLDKSNVLGSIYENSERGIYGVLNQNAAEHLYSEPIPAMPASEVKTGDASVLCSLENGDVMQYSIKIEDIDINHAEPDKGIVLRVTDDRLKSQTGGIIQGMSGSPIIQDGKLVGAVTHVFVREPDKGYGIFIENMI